ncbi:toll/interleukin-1 receptor domain-containing protein [Rathayibacter toxicus]|uniref:toll/interleukin-1 receptor domain-containing protein n=1 Tax=Rathayibacter toxicus TaxID=145458 RepID=UPI0006990437|nr:TIR domain-containing protein [Rathayibacter toxicus]ALS57686.1 hypothetical protein APU90_07825 [Rathayibacter toxicus]PPG20642.1 TIR domain-containing protein [Rathayibacter toxicus]PPG45745.1 TIR domain-containing protein [Rathayibacter toxicus]PPH62324.1 TIR domain-containing protein [Rathayibacter toxicus]PPH66935.1 TIR domain-containing protein [Rathayibacter toxicus]
MTEHDFDIAVTFAGEDREFVEAVVELVKSAGFKVFYDEDHKYESWGEDLTEYFPDVYERRARYAVMFISKDYAAKPWTRLERRSVLARALEEEKPYLLPVRLDSTKLPGVRDVIGYLDGHIETPVGIANAITTKLGAPNSDGIRLFNGRVPRTAAELSILLGERPPAWEYLMLSYHLSEKTTALKTQYINHRLGFAVPQGFLPDEELPDTLRREIAILSATANMLESLLLGPAQDEAMGAPGKSGDPDLIEELADRIVQLYAQLMAWSAKLHALATESEEGAATVKTLAAYSNQPVEAMHQFFIDHLQFLDEISPRLQAGENVSIQLPLKFELPDELTQKFDAQLEAFKRRHR